MATRMLELRVGASILVASLILIIGVMWFQGFKFGEETTLYNVVFPQVGRLTKGDVVTVAGVRVGKVVEVSLRGKDVLVVLAVDRDVRLGVDCRVHVANVGIMGERFVSIVPGTSDRYFEEGAYLPGVYDEGLSEIMGAVGSMLTDLSEITASFNELAGVLLDDGGLEEAIGRMVRLTGRVDSLVRAVSPPLTRAAGDFAEISGDLKGIVRENGEPFRDGLRSFREATAAFERAGVRVDSLASRLALIGEALEDPSTNLGRLLRDGTLMEDLEETVRDLDDILEDIKANPKKYFKFSLF